MARPELWAALALALAGCGEEGPSPDLVADITRLQELIQADPALEPIAAADTISDARPVHAARLLETGAVPAARQQVEAFEEAEVQTPEARSFARRAVRIYRARLEALEAHQAVLEAGVTADPAAALDAIRARREAEVDLLALVDDMAQVSPTSGRPRPPANPPADSPAGGSGAPDRPPEGAAPLTGSPRENTPAAP